MINVPFSLPTKAEVGAVDVSPDVPSSSSFFGKSSVKELNEREVINRHVHSVKKTTLFDLGHRLKPFFR
jgi:hypothetical protein